MPLESLHELVGTLRNRIETHADALRSSEAQTRYALIDPLLRELGWDTEDPVRVRPEYPLKTEYNPGTRSADYALLANGIPAMMVEAKRLGTPLRDQVLVQGINYCQVEGTKYFAVTDGRYWEIYETHKPVPIDEKRVIAFDLCESDAASVCLKALALWRPSVRSGHVAPGKDSVVGKPHDYTATASSPAPLEVGPQRSQVVPDSHDWQELPKVTVVHGQQPVEMLFPDNSKAAMKSWNSAPVEAVRWLTNKRLLSISDCPIMAKSSKAFRYMVHTEPVHSNGNAFTVPREVGGLYVEAHDNQSMLITKTKTIIERVGQDPAQFKVRFS